jgi:uncharacterized protein YneF (UPF0154 family)
MKILLIIGIILAITIVIIGYQISNKLQNKLLEKDEKKILNNALKRNLDPKDKEYFEKRLGKFKEKE